MRDLYTGEVLADLVGQGDRWMAAAGGRGGRGNAKFLSNRRRAPSFAEQGEHGEERWLKLELKLMADVALVGFPNAGKSTFISADLGGQAQGGRLPVHDAGTPPRRGPARRRLRDGGGRHPRPHRGRQRGPGLGHQFLRHVERARALCVLVDLASLEATHPGAGRGAAPRARRLPARLCSTAPGVVVGSKADVAVTPWDGLQHVGGHRRGRAARCSAGCAAWSRRPARPSRHSDGFVIHRPQPEGVEVEARRASTSSGCTGGRPCGPWRSPTSRDAECPGLRRPPAQVGSASTRRWHAPARAPGDVVRVGDFSFDYEPDL